MINLCFFGGIVNSLVGNPLESREEAPKTVLEVVLLIGNFIINIDSFCFSLKSGGKLIELLDNEETHAIDNNLKIANRILGTFFLKIL
jgi:hypothetical protein